MNVAKKSAKSVDAKTLRKVESIVAWFRNNGATVAAKRKEAVKRMVNFTTEELNLVGKALKKIFGTSAMVDRMLACAIRNIPQADHLYGINQSVKAQDILEASDVALAQIANPNTNFDYLQDSGKVVVVKAKDLPEKLGSKYTAYVWDCRVGVIGVAEQRVRTKIRLTKAQARASAGGITRIKAAAGVTIGGEKCVVFTNMNGTTITRSVKELRHYLKGK